jgi:hypothetical protein
MVVFSWKKAAKLAAAPKLGKRGYGSCRALRKTGKDVGAKPDSDFQRE